MPLACQDRESRLAACRSRKRAPAAHGAGWRRSRPGDLVRWASGDRDGCQRSDPIDAVFPTQRRLPAGAVREFVIEFTFRLDGCIDPGLMWVSDMPKVAVTALGISGTRSAPKGDRIRRHRRERERQLLGLSSRMLTGPITGTSGSRIRTFM